MTTEVANYFHQYQAQKDRDAYITGLRALADLLDAKPDLPLPVTDSFHWYLFGTKSLAAQKAEAARLVRLIGGKHDKEDTSELYRFISHLHGVETQVIVDRPAVCERVVISADVVTKQVPDPAAPLVEITETVEQVEWRCRPLFADDVEPVERERFDMSGATPGAER